MLGGMGVEVSVELLDLQKWFTYQNLQDFTREQMKMFEILSFHCIWLEISD